MPQPHPLAGPAQMELRVRAGANWIYWIAALSAINAFAALFGSGMALLVALIAPVTLGALAQGSSTIAAKVVLICAAVSVCCVFALLGIFASKGARWAFLVAILCYAADTGLWFIFKGWPSGLIHLYVLWRLGAGAQAAFVLAKVRRQISGSQAVGHIQPPAQSPVDSGSGGTMPAPAEE